MKNIFEENPNPSAKIAFVMWTPFHYWVYKNIIKHLPEAEFVICDTWYSSIYQRGAAHINEVIEFLKNQGTNWRVITELIDGEKIKKFFAKYEIIAATNFWPPLDVLGLESSLSGQKGVLVNYGVGKDLATAAPWVSNFDISLVEGERTHEFHKTLTESHIVGYPKFDDWFGRKIDNNKVGEIKSKLIQDKKTVLYLPTHSGLSSLSKFAAGVSELTEKLNVLVKFHHLNRLTETEAVKEIEKKDGILAFDSKDDIQPLLFVADSVISDSSSAAFEAVLTDKPLVVLDTTAGSLASHVSGEEFNGLWYSGGLTYAKSIDELIKHDDAFRVGEVAKTPDEIYKAVDSSLRSKTDFISNRKRLREELFAYNDGRCGDRAASIIRGLLGHPKSRQPVLGIAARAYLSTLSKNYNIGLRNAVTEAKEAVFKKMRTQSENIGASPRNYFENIRHNPVKDGGIIRTKGVFFHKNINSKIPDGDFLCSVIVPTYNRERNLKKALVGLMDQSIDSNRYEIIIVDDGSIDGTRGVVGGFIKKYPDRAIRYFWQKNGGPARARNKGITEAKGDIIFFTDDDCVVSTNWMETLLSALTRYPEAAGVGGWIKPPEDEVDRSAVSRYIYLNVYFPDSAAGRRVKHYEILSNDPLMCFGVFAYNTANVCYRKKVLKEVGGFRDKFYWPGSEDNDLAFRIANANHHLLYIPFHVTHSKDMSLVDFAKLHFKRGANGYLMRILNREALEELGLESVERYGSVFSFKLKFSGPVKYLAFIEFICVKLGILFMKQKLTGSNPVKKYTPQSV